MPVSEQLLLNVGQQTKHPNLIFADLAFLSFAFPLKAFPLLSSDFSGQSSVVCFSILCYTFMETVNKDCWTELNMSSTSLDHCSVLLARPVSHTCSCMNLNPRSSFSDPGRLNTDNSKTPEVAKNQLKLWDKSPTARLADKKLEWNLLRLHHQKKRFKLFHAGVSLHSGDCTLEWYTTVSLPMRECLLMCLLFLLC